MTYIPPGENIFIVMNATASKGSSPTTWPEMSVDGMYPTEGLAQTRAKALWNPGGVAVRICAMPVVATYDPK
jgi:hypothetical protein